MIYDYDKKAKELKASLDVLLAVKALNEDDFIAIIDVLTKAMERLTK